MTGLCGFLGDTLFMEKHEDAGVEWVNPLVDASNRDLATSRWKTGHQRPPLAMILQVSYMVACSPQITLILA
jgi:hypothetical protein